MQFTKSPDFIIREADPFNGEPPVNKLTQSFITPVEDFYVRNHGTLPAMDAATHRLAVTNSTGKSIQLSMDDLQSRFKSHAQATTLQCAGNRREELIRVRDIAGETPWSAGAIGNAQFEGARLCEVLESAGIDRGTAQHVEFIGQDQCQRENRTFHFGASIPIMRAMKGDVLLAWNMNGAPLAPVHGFPLRVIVPGYLGARNVKWLSSIIARDTTSENYFQAHAYKLFPPQVDKQSADWNKGLILGEMSITSAITSPEPTIGSNGRVKAGRVAVRGYAIAGGSRTVERVDVSTDDGQSWKTAKLSSAPVGSWRFWTIDLDLPPGEVRLAARAFDSSANSQPENPEAIWNFKGYMNNAWHRVRLLVE